MKTLTKIPPSFRLAALVAAAALPLLACNAGHWTEPRIGAHGPQAVVYIEGQGTVTSDALKVRCGTGVPDAESRCKGDSNSPAQVRLVAEPASGWDFDHWEVDRANRACFDPARGAAFSYTAVFVPRPVARVALDAR